MQRKWVVSLAIDGQDEITAEGTMNAIDQLMAEHELIVEVLDALDGYASNVERGTEVEPSDLAELVRFLREFADGCHHAKEEGILFAAMEQAGFPREMGPLAVMLAEHEQGRGYIARLRAVATVLPTGRRRIAPSSPLRPTITRRCCAVTSPRRTASCFPWPRLGSTVRSWRA